MLFVCKACTFERFSMVVVAMLNYVTRKDVCTLVRYGTGKHYASHSVHHPVCVLRIPYALHYYIKSITTITTTVLYMFNITSTAPFRRHVNT